MSDDDAYIPPSKRRIASEESLTVPCGCGSCLSCEFGYGTKTIHRRLTIDDHGLLASHAVLDSVAADLAAALRPLLETERYNLPQCIERDTGACALAKECVSGCGLDEAWDTYCKHRAALARYDALHKEAGNE